jgi:hypothetical protein
VRVFHFLNRQYGLQDIERRRLKIATLNDLNDPFDLLGPGTDDRHTRLRFQVTKDQLAVDRGMLCFSRNWKNPVQWSHYADGHRGLCLGFDIPKKYLIPVKYRAKRLEPNVARLEGGGPQAEGEMQKILSTKYIHWRYEHELRCFLRLDDRDFDTGLYFAGFSPMLRLREVIVGHCCTLTRSELQNALGDLARRVSAYKARLAFRSYNVVRQRNERLWP